MKKFIGILLAVLLLFTSTSAMAEDSSEGLFLGLREYTLTSVYDLTAQTSTRIVKPSPTSTFDNTETIVLLPSLGQPVPSITFRGLAEDLKKQGFIVVIYEPLGYGFSSTLQGENTQQPSRSISNIIYELETTIKTLGITHCTIMAHSMYGAYALGMTQQGYTIDAFIGLDISVPEQVYYTGTGEFDAMVEYGEIVDYYRNQGMVEYLFPDDTYDINYADSAYVYPSDELTAYKEMYLQTIFSRLVIDEISFGATNFAYLENFKFNMPVLNILSSDNCSYGEFFPWQAMHEELCLNPKSKTVIVDGSHYFYYDRSKEIATMTRNFLNSL